MNTLKDMIRNMRTQEAMRNGSAPAAHAARQIVSPFDGDPRTGFITDAAGRVVGAAIEAAALTPLRAKCADFLGGLSAFAAIALGLYLLASLSDPAPYLWVLVIVVPLVLAGLMQAGYRRLLKKRTVLLFAPTHLAVRSGHGQPVIYDRQEPHKFRMRLHEKAKKEAEDHETEQMKARMRGRIIRKKKYYRDTYTLELAYRSYPRTVMDIMGERDAVRILARIKDVDAAMDQLMAMGAMPSSGAKSDWDDMAGKIPEKV